MNKINVVILASLQIIVGVLASVYLLRVLLGGSVTISLIIAIPVAILGLLLGCRNIIKLKGMK